jgi:type IV pilus assembly protein PilO
MEIAGVELSDLELSEIGSWPLLIRQLIWVGCFVATLGMGYVYVLQDQWNTLTNAIETDKKSRGDFKKNHEQVSNLDTYRTQMKEIRQKFNTFKNQLPQIYRSEELLEELSQKATANRLEFVTIKPQPEQNKGFYIEYPIDLTLSGGNYHQLGEFVSDVSNMARIVTLHDFSIKMDKSLTMNVNAKTYTYTGEDKKT